MNHMGVGAFRFAHEFEAQTPSKNFFPQDSDLHFCEAIADTAMNTEAKGQMVSWVLTIDNKVICIFYDLLVSIPRQIPQ